MAMLEVRDLRTSFFTPAGEVKAVNGISFNLDSGKVLESSGSLDELSRQLAPYGCFYRPHRSYLVNLEYVQTLSYRAITLACLAEIPIPRGKYNEVKSAFLDYAFQKGQVTV